ncbi:D-amino acid dehydrogenase [Acidovorax sp. sic0104]|uniref:D-amino acid dehydrogenase n=1 Tax=Acidovorax sp. sic0104 TaxID=2854784 RepID=UPI001C47CDAB|nr:D-amino acid dehydrogenase [Acidovorax sp. sic0104]MBV7539713.1 D-amino acid dehydrogenase [Acidovorax sp. sic0104]
MQVCVLGAGIVGLATAYELQRRGMTVTVIDQALPGAGASGGNGAQLSYSYVQPLADAGIWRQLPKLLLSPRSPLKLRPQWDTQQWRWGVEFLRACNRSTSERSTRRLLALAALSRHHFEAMLQTEALDCDFSTTGKLVLYDTPAGLSAARRQMDLQQPWGGPQEAVSAARCIELEPALAHYQGHIVGAIHTPSECAADCLKVCQGLQRLLTARGVRFVLGAKVQGFLREGRRIVAARTSAGDIEAQQFVLALGSASHRAARMLGFRLPIYPLKGYSITLDTAGAPGIAPRVSVTDAARKVVFARIGDRLRVAGMAELVGHDDSIPPARIRSLCQATSAIFPGCGDFGTLRPWTGMRPATPTGVPMTGAHAGAPDNLLINTGHGALGFTLAFGTAAQVAQLLAPD